MANMPQVQQNSSQWNDEVRQFSHSIAKDCDNAFNSSLLSPESCLGNTPNESSISVDATPLSLNLPTSIPALDGDKEMEWDARPWDRRPLPPTPSSTTSTRHELTIAKKRAKRQEGDNGERPLQTNRGAYLLDNMALGRNSALDDEGNRRIVSAPIYSQYSTQWGKDKLPLPSIHEKSREEGRSNDGDRPRVVSAPAGYAKAGSMQMDDHTGLEYLARQDHTIRIVTSPSVKPYTGAEPTDPLDMHKQLFRGNTAYSQSKQELDLRERYISGELACTAPGQEVPSEDFASSTLTKKKSSWFKRGSKNGEDVFNTRGGSTSSRTDRLTYTSTTSSGGPAIPPAKKKSFNLAFWRNGKDQAQMQISLAGKWDCPVRRVSPILMTGVGSDMDDTPSPQPARMFSHPARPHYDTKWGDEATTRNIEPQQNWLARLFRVRPATKHLCFSISRRRARQEIVILLKEWRKYGIRDVQVDKKRNIVFARVGQKNCK
jgi:hypothetical protein